MEKICAVTKVCWLGGHRLRLDFDDGSSGEVNFSGESWRGVFAPLTDPAYFGAVKLDGQLGTIVWPNGADMAPETLHRLVNEGSSLKR